jgi:hypothetical protein
MNLKAMLDYELVEEWSLFNDILQECKTSQSSFDIQMRELLEEEIKLRGGEFDIDGDTRSFSCFNPISTIDNKQKSIEDEDEDAQEYINSISEEYDLSFSELNNIKQH